MCGWDGGRAWRVRPVAKYGRISAAVVEEAYMRKWAAPDSVGARPGYERRRSVLNYIG